VGAGREDSLKAGHRTGAGRGPDATMGIPPQAERYSRRGVRVGGEELKKRHNLSVLSVMRVTGVLGRKCLSGKGVEMKAGKNGPPASALARIFSKKLKIWFCR
jgi:hypothetical protein